MDALSSQRDFVYRALLIVGISTLLLTASFVGLLGLISGEAEVLGSRIPYYLVAMGVAFVATILLLEEHESDGQVVIVTASVIGLITLVTITLSVEGVLFAIRNPDLVFVSQLVYYFIAAALIGTGIGYWGVRHWREFAGQSPSRSGGL